MKANNVISLFDGMGCGRMALKRNGVLISNYYASEIDKYAIKACKTINPDVQHIGDVTLVKGADYPKIDLLIGGSPCQGFSFAGKQLNFSDPRSALFFEFVRILKELRRVNPNIKFMLENVKMKKEFQDVISKHLGVEPININSNLVSAQNRLRLYWTNIANVMAPEDLGLELTDILESGVVDRQKSYCLDTSYYKGGNLRSYFEKHRRQLVFEAKNGKRVTINQDQIYTPKTFYETRTEYGKQQRKILSKLAGKDTTPRDKLCKHYVPQKHGKANCIVTVDSFLNWIIDKEYYCRKLTLIECGRLQTVKDEDIYSLIKAGISNTQIYKMLGNGWTTDVISHILSFGEFT